MALSLLEKNRWLWAGPNFVLQELSVGTASLNVALKINHSLDHVKLSTGTFSVLSLTKLMIRRGEIRL